LLEEKIYVGIQMAVENLETVKIESQKGICKIGIHRSHCVDRGDTFGSKSYGACESRIDANKISNGVG
jgi:hypothetical protein